MSDFQERKHKLLQLDATVISNTVRYSRMWGWRSPSIEDIEEEQEEEELDSVIYDRWKTPIVSSIAQYNSKYSYKIEHKAKVVATKKFDEHILRKLKRYEVNTWNIFFYKVFTPWGWEDICNYFQKILKLPSFKFVKFDFNNTCLCCTLNYHDSWKLLAFFEYIISEKSRDDIHKNLRSLNLVKWFQLLDHLDKSLFNLHLENQNIYYIVVPEDVAILHTDLKEVVALFDLTLIEKIIKADWIYITIEGAQNNFDDFLLFFEFPDSIFSMEIVTKVFDDQNAPANIYKELATPPLELENIENLPIVFLLDSGLALNKDVLNPLLVDIVQKQDTIEQLKNEIPIRNHATQMAGIIAYGEQLYDIDDKLAFTSRTLYPSARIYSLFVWTDKPKIGIWSLPSLFWILNNTDAVLNQNIKIYNLSRNISVPKKDNDNISFISYLVDKYLFFQPDILVLNSVGNYEGPKPPNFHTFSHSNLNIPSDAINILSIGSFKIMTDKKLSVSKGTSKNHYDRWSISNPLKNNIIAWNSIKRSNNKYSKPDILWLGERWNSTTQDTNFNLLTLNPCSWTSHATAYVSHLSAKIIWLYPDLKYAMTVEAILQHFLSDNIDSELEITDEHPFSKKLNDRIDHIKDKANFSHNEIIQKENEFLKERYVGWGVVDISNLNKFFYNDKNSLTFVVEWKINLWSMQYHSIDLLDYITRETLEQNTIKFDWFISFRGLPYLKDSIGYNMLNIVSSFRSKNDYSTQDWIFNGKEQMKWSWNSTCHTRMRYPKTSIPSITTRTTAFRNLIIDNDWNLDIMVKSFVRKNREKDIKKLIKEYFDNLEDDSYCADFLQSTYYNYQATNSISRSLRKIPYSIVVSVSVLADVDVYDTITLTEDIDL